MPSLRDAVSVFLKTRPSPRELWASRTGSFHRLHAICPSDVVAGEPVEVVVQAWDEYERRHAAFAESLPVGATDDAATTPERVDFAAVDGAVTRFEATFGTPGVHRLLFERPGRDDRAGEPYVSNPVRVHADEPGERRYWGDIHLHSQFSDGAGTMEKGLRYGRDVMALDVAAYTDHDTMGFFIPPGWQRRRMHEGLFEEMKAITDEFHEPGEYVTLFGYEWTKQPNRGGHVNVYFDCVDRAELFDSHAPDSHTYEGLWERLRAWREETGRDVVTIPHHTAEAMYPFDFDATEYDDELAPLVEVYSQWGSSERPGSAGNRYPLAMGQGEIDQPGHYVADALRMGHRVGLLAGSDYHGPYPGHSLLHAPPHLPSWADWREDGIGWGHIWRVWSERSYPGGLTAFRAPELTREAVFDALRSRAVYGTAQPHRILVAFSVDGTRPGDDDSTTTVDAPDAERTVELAVHGTAPLERITVVKNGAEWWSFAGTADPDAPLAAYDHAATITDDEPVTGLAWDDDRGTDADVYYLRVWQVPRYGEHGGAAWAGPVWVEVA